MDLYTSKIPQLVDNIVFRSILIYRRTRGERPFIYSIWNHLVLLGIVPRFVDDFSKRRLALILPSFGNMTISSPFRLAIRHTMFVVDLYSSAKRYSSRKNRTTLEAWFLYIKKYRHIPVYHSFARVSPTPYPYPHLHGHSDVERKFSPPNLTEKKYNSAMKCPCFSYTSS